MIEVIYKEDKQEAKGNEGVFSIPRNIRQIGLINDRCRIYVEDYVYTFLGRIAKENTSVGNGKLAVLTGESKWLDGITYIFIYGALLIEHAEVSADHIVLSEDEWKTIHEEGSYYFPHQEIVGWFFSQPEMNMEITEIFRHTHLKYFGGGEKVLMLMNPSENEEAFFKYENNFLIRQSGYYLYYEKNPFMQAYMSEKRPEYKEENAEKTPDDAVKKFRTIIKKKKQLDENEAEDKTSVFSYAATACLVLALASVGIRFYHNYQELQNVKRQTEETAALYDGEFSEVVSDIVVTPTTKNTNAAPTMTPVPEVKDKTVDVGGSLETNGGLNAASGENTILGSNTALEADPASDETKEADIYKEESDIRKAERRIAQKEEAVSYVIRPGDTLYQISLAKYGTLDAVSDICQINGFAEDEIIYPGQVIVLP